MSCRQQTKRNRWKLNIFFCTEANLPLFYSGEAVTSQQLTFSSSLEFLDLTSTDSLDGSHYFINIYK